ncbi:MAG: monovalent cation/H(+) antiporter subunit G [Desulfotomaculales bacterium]
MHVDLRTIVTAVLLATGCFLLIIAAIGVVRFPDFYSRMHPAGKGDTLGQALILLGLMVYEGFSFVSVKLFFIALFIFVANPTATHFIAKAAYLGGLKPWRRPEVESAASENGAVSEE